MVTDPNWEEKLQPLIERDQFIREALHNRGVLSDAYHPEMEKCHIENSKKLQKLIKDHGFPVLSNAGEKGVRYSWLIIQHSISLPDFMKEALLQMRLAAAASDYPLELLASTEDSVAYFEGRKQIYGTFFDWQEGELRPVPIDDAHFVDHRRKSMGLPPLAEALFKFSHELPPKDPVKKLKDFEAWLKKVGWRN